MTLPAAPEPRVVQAMREFQTGILNREVQQFLEMTRRWRGVENALQGQIFALAAEIEQMRQAGETVGVAKIARMQRYRALLAQLKQQMRVYNDYAAGRISGEQQYLAGLGIENASQALALKGVILGFDRLPVEATNNMIGLAGNGSPLAKLLKNAWPEAAEGLSDALIRGVALGWNPTQTARAMLEGLGWGLQRFLLIARTEQLRVYREASRMQYQASGEVIGYRRLASKSTRTCIACLVADGRFYPLNVSFEEHPRGRCTAVPVLRGEEGQAPGWQLGRAWFESLDASEQGKILGPKFFSAWKNGLYSLDQIVKRHDDPEWGASLQVRPLRELLAA